MEVTWLEFPVLDPDGAATVIGRLSVRDPARVTVRVSPLGMKAACPGGLREWWWALPSRALLCRLC